MAAELIFCQEIIKYKDKNGVLLSNEAILGRWGEYRILWTIRCNGLWGAISI